MPVSDTKLANLESELHSVKYRNGVLIWVFGLVSTTLGILLVAGIPWAMSIESELTGVKTRQDTYTEQGPAWLIQRVNEHAFDLKMHRDLIRQIEARIGTLDKVPISRNGEQ